VALATFGGMSMTRERWGAFSVVDHINAAALVPEILLYDRLVIPVPHDEYFDDRQRWRDKGWQPELLDQRLTELGELAVRVTWNLERQQMFRLEMDKLRSVEIEARLPYQATAGVLASEKPKLPDGVSHVDVVAAYPSEEAYKAEIKLKEAVRDQGNLDTPGLARLGLMFGHLLAIPQDKANPEKALREAIDLAKDRDFKAKRQAFYEWQIKVINQGYTVEEAKDEMEELIKKYNNCVKKAVRTVAYKFAFTIAEVGLSLVGATLNPVIASGAALSIMKFAAFDARPVIEAEESKPAAMFHTAAYKRAGVYQKLRTFI
jgi:hypothetical protein